MNRRITFVSRGRDLREWEIADSATKRVICVEPLKVLAYAVTVVDNRLDVERVILDGSATATDFLDLLASLPHDLIADVMMIRADGSAFLSAMARGGSRVLYALAANDVRFYLETHGLVVYDRIVRMTA
jgi:hypothetical protein